MVGGEGPLTNEEEEFVGQFSNELAAKQALSLHRKNQVMVSLNGGGPLNEDEQQAVSRLMGPDRDIIGKQIVSIKRRTRLLRYLNGDENEDLS